jgi:hypothetical protein
VAEESIPPFLVVKMSQSASGVPAVLLLLALQLLHLAVACFVLLEPTLILELLIVAYALPGPLGASTTL